MRIVFTTILFFLFFSFASAQNDSSAATDVQTHFFVNSFYSDKLNDTIFFLGEPGRIDKVIHNGFVSQFYYSTGNLLAEGRVILLHCNDVVEGEFRCESDSLNGRSGWWTLYYNQQKKIKFAEVYFERGVKKQTVFYDKRQIVTAKEIINNDVIRMITIDYKGNPKREEEFIYIDKKKKILSEYEYQNGELKELKNVPSFFRFFIIHNDFFFKLILFFVGIKLVTSFWIFNLESDNDKNVFLRRFEMAFKASFMLYMKPFNKDYFLLFYLHNFSSLVFVLVLTLVIISINW